MRVVNVLTATGENKTYQGPEYRALLERSLRALKKLGKPLPFSEAQAKSLPLTDLVAMDNAWAAENKAGTHTSVVER